MKICNLIYKNEKEKEEYVCMNNIYFDLTKPCSSMISNTLVFHLIHFLYVYY